jgi:RNA-splicing ligase RtcB
MNYSNLLQSKAPVKKILDHFTQNEANHRFEIIDAVASNSMFVNSEIKDWVRQSLMKVNLEDIKPKEWDTIASFAILDSNKIPPHFLDQYEYLLACIRIDAVKALMFLRFANPPSLYENVERFRKQRLFISLDAWDAIKF